MSASPPEPAVRPRHVNVLRDLLSAGGRAAIEWDAWIEPDRAGVQIRPLYRTEEPRAASAFLVRYGPGAHGDLHEHLGYELMFVLEGEMINDNGDRYGVGDLIIEEPGSVHRITTQGGFTVLAVREAPTVPR